MTTKTKKRIWKPDYKFNPQIHGEKNEEKSMTVAGEAFTVAELYKRAVAGLPLTAKNAMFSDDENDTVDYQKLYNMDIYDQQQYLKELKDKIDSIQQEQDAMLKQIKEAKNEVQKTDDSK